MGNLPAERMYTVRVLASQVVDVDVVAAVSSAPPILEAKASVQGLLARADNKAEALATCGRITRHPCFWRVVGEAPGRG